MPKVLALLLLLVAFPGCATKASSDAAGANAAASTAPEVEVPAEMRAEADRLAGTLLRELKAALEAEMKKGKPAEAIAVCSELAPEIAGRLSRESGWQVRRTGTRVRNPMLGMPDAWEQGVLADFARRAAAGEALEGMTHAGVVDEPAGQFVRVVRAIPVGAPCVACHGPREAMAPALAEAIRTMYPHDAATGYAPGELRGAVTLKAPLPASR